MRKGFYLLTALIFAIGLFINGCGEEDRNSEDLNYKNEKAVNEMLEKMRKSTN